MGGGNDGGHARHYVGGGLSPRGRGKPNRNTSASVDVRSIPAWAGETRSLSCLPCIRMVYPRVGGGNPTPPVCAHALEGLSPRGRGKPQRLIPLARGVRSIPAWAGETRALITPALVCGVYPRVGGGNLGYWRAQMCGGGLSPRGRGKLGARAIPTLACRSIPAWAGETKTAISAG